MGSLPQSNPPYESAGIEKLCRFPAWDVYSIPFHLGRVHFHIVQNYFLEYI